MHVRSIVTYAHGGSLGLHLIDGLAEHEAEMAFLMYRMP